MELNVPIQFTKQAFQDGRKNELKLLLALKFLHRQGQVRKSNISLSDIHSITGWQSKTTTYRYLSNLLQLNWIGTDGEWYFLRSFKRLNEGNSKTHVKTRVKDVSSIRSFMLSAWIGYRYRLVKSRQKSNSKKRETSLPIGSEYLVSCSVIAKEFGCSRSTASRMKQKAVSCNYLEYKHRYEKLHIPNQFIEYCDVEPERLMKTSVGLVRRKTDSFTVNLSNNNDNHRFYYRTI